MHVPRLTAWKRLLALLAYAAATCLAQTGNQAQVVGLTGSLMVKRGFEVFRPLSLNDTVVAGDELLTGENSEALIRFRDGSTVRLFPDSQVILREPSGNLREFLHLFLGSVKVHIERLTGRPSPHRMTTSTAVIAVRGTDFSVFVDEHDSTMVAVDSGLVAVANIVTPAVEVLVRPGERTWVQRDMPPMMAQRFRGPSERADLVPGLALGRERAEAARQRSGGVGPPSGVPPVATQAGGPPADTPAARRPGPPLR